jgi:hypothetical protein
MLAFANLGTRATGVRPAARAPAINIDLIVVMAFSLRLLIHISKRVNRDRVCVHGGLPSLAAASSLQVLLETVMTITKLRIAQRNIHN